jgi:hypothetical protein
MSHSFIHLLIRLKLFCNAFIAKICIYLHFNQQNDYLLAIHVFKLWHRFQSQTLITAIELKLIPIITIDNIDIIYKLSTFYELKQLVKSCKSLIDQNVNQFVTNFGIEDIKSMPIRITLYWKLLPILWFKRQEIMKDS